MNVTLTPQHEEMVRRKIEAGQYSDVSEVIREALALMEHEDKLNRLRATIAVGDDQFDRGEFSVWSSTTLDEIVRSAKEADRRGLPISDDVQP